jgi:hypothetical protein
MHAGTRIGAVAGAGEVLTGSGLVFKVWEPIS